MRQTAVGLDLGAHTVKAVQVRYRGTEASIEKRLALPRTALAAEGVDVADPRALVRAVRARLAALEMRSRGVVFAIDGRESILRYSHVPAMPARRLEMMMKYEVDSLAERMEEPLASDFRVLPVLREADGEHTVLLGVAKERNLEAVLDALEREGVTVEAAVPAPLALYRAWDMFATKADPDAPEDDLVLAADMGSSSLNVALILNGRLVFARSASFGGDNFTDSLAQALDLSKDDAERFKVERGGLDGTKQGVDDRSVAPLRNAAGQLLGLLQSTLRFAASQAGLRLPPLSRLWLCGGAMQLKGLAAYISDALGRKPVEHFDASGLALGLSAVAVDRGRRGEGRVHLDILPGRYRQRRTFWERTVCLYAAAGLLVVLLAARFAQGVVRNSAAAGVREALETQHKELTALHSRMTENSAEGERMRARANRLLLEAEPTAFQAFVLDFLGRNLRPGFQLEAVDLEAEEGDEGAVTRYRLHIRGRVNNESRRGHEWLLELQAALKQEERIRDAVISKPKPEGAWYAFEMSIEPNNTTL